MTLQSSPSPIKFSDIIQEFGVTETSGSSKLGSYRVKETYGALTNIPLDTNIPQSGQIKFSDFYGKQLNVVVDFYSGSSVVRKNAKSRYESDNVNVVGGFKEKPSVTSGTKVIIHVNKIIGSSKSGDNHVALKTGNWDSNTNLDLQNYGSILGAGGDGGNGGGRSTTKTDGTRATSGLGVSYPLEIYNYGTIAGGGGGGNGASGNSSSSRRRFRCGWWCEGRRRSRRRSQGGGGGGGAGFPVGSGGSGYNAGSDGDTTGGGSGGSGQGRGAGGGGDGGNLGVAAGGSAGRAIIISGSGSVSKPVPGTILGGEINGTFT